jgi:hypothetical protein
MYEAALAYVPDSLDAEEIERRFGASTDEIEGMRDDPEMRSQRKTKLATSAL